MFFRQIMVSMIAFALATAGAVAQENDAGHGSDYRTFTADNVAYGQIGDSYTADLVLYLAGNQFMVIEELIGDFQSLNPDITTIYVETIPPGQILNGQILAQGQIEGQDTAMNPDIYASVRVNHLQRLAKDGIMHDYMTYIHNKLELMVAEGNPKDIKGVDDLGRDDLVQSHPNPQSEGIFRFYGSEMLKEAGLYEKVTGNADCRECWAIEGKTWFTARHHRETPDRIENGEADVGIVWTTEVIEAKKQGRKIDGVAIPDEQNKADVVGYAIGALQNGRNPYNAMRFLSYLGTDRAQGIYESYAFIPATAEELKLKPLVAQ